MDKSIRNAPYSKIYIQIIFFPLIIGLLYSQSGYKEFSWGEHLASVSKKTVELSDETFWNRFQGLHIAYFYENSELYEYSIPNPIKYLEGELLALEERTEHRVFYFLDSSLIAIQLKYFEDDIISAMESKYGDVTSKYMSFGPNNFEIKAWFDNGDRIITCQKFIGGGLEFVAYIDKNLYYEVSKPLKDERINERKKSTNKLD